MKRKLKPKAKRGVLLHRLVGRIETERKLCLERMAIYRAKGFKEQYYFTNGQYDSLGGVLHWLHDTPND